MNRAQRRAARRQPATCDCTPRLLVPVEREPLCAGCGTVLHVAVGGFAMHTMADPGDLTTVYASCVCGADSGVVCLVQPL